MNWKPIIIAVVITGLVMSCKKSSEDTSEDSASTGDILVQALAEGGAHASSTEGGSAAIASKVSLNEMNVLEEEIQFAKNSAGFISHADQVNQLATACKFSTRVCSSNTGTIDWNSCTISGPKAVLTMSGGWTETWTNTGDCTNGYLSLLESVTRRSTSSVISFPGGSTLTTDTQGGSAWDGTVFTAGGIIITRAQAQVRNIAVSPANSAIHKVLKGRRGTTLFDYYSVPSLTVSGTRTNGSGSGLGSSGSNRALNGTVTVYHNLAQYNATNTFSAVTWSDATCCFPTSGSISTTFTGAGAPTGPVTLTFSTNCGVAKLASPENTTGTDIELVNCQ